MQTHMLREHPEGADQFRSGGMGGDGFKMAHQMGPNCHESISEFSVLFTSGESSEALVSKRVEAMVQVSKEHVGHMF